MDDTDVGDVPYTLYDVYEDQQAALGKDGYDGAMYCCVIL